MTCAFALGGCGGVQFEGKVFDYMGISGDRKDGDVQMSERPPLLLPPNPKNLPPPGTGVAAATARQDWPQDPERVRKRIVEEKKAQEATEEAKNDPINPYAGKPTLLDKLFSRSKTVEEPIPDVPEPDPSDRVAEDEAQDVATSRPKPLTPHVPQAPVQTQSEQPAAPGSYSDPTTRRNLY